MPAKSEPRPAPEGNEEVGALLVELVDHLDAMVAYWDGEQRCRFANRAYKDWFGRGRKELLGTTLAELLGPLYVVNLPHIEAAYRGEKQVFQRPIPRPDGMGVRHSLATYTPRVVDGRVTGIFVHVADVEPLKKLEVELTASRDQAEELATHDFLTGLPNRRLLDDRLNELIARARRSGEKMFAMSIDVDDFKPVNDRHGHVAGDALLVELVSRMNSCVRGYDTLARVGGDEFVLVAPGIDSEVEILDLAERILEAVDRPHAIGDAVVTPTMSIGIAKFPTDGTTKEAWLAASDRALYDAKRAGRNCVRLAGAASSEGEADAKRRRGGVQNQ
jgi:diguanylate cyclase (GGDEF)-like protein/PAS domain S-box-containing protein